MQSGTTKKDFTVAIIGGGMCGLTLAIALARSGIQCDLFESASKFGEVGAGVGLGPNAIQALDALGLLDTITSHIHQQPVVRAFAFVTGIEEPGENGYKYIYDYPTTEKDVGLGIHRSLFLDALIPLLPPHIAHFNKRCIDVTYAPQTDKYHVHFADGTNHTTDLVVGADGIRSAVRARAVFVEDGIKVADKSGIDMVKHDDLDSTPAGYDKHLSFSGWKAYRALIPLQELKDAGIKMDLSRSLCVVGPYRHIITFPIEGGKIVNVVAFSNPPDSDSTSTPGAPRPPLPPPWVKGPVPTSELLQVYEGCNTDTKILLEHMKNPSVWYIHELNPPLQSFVSRISSNTTGRVVLIGDAAHASTPHLGAGVGQGFEDVHLLWRLLSHPKTIISNLEDTLKAYDTIRRSRANDIVTRSHNCGILYERYGLFESSGGEFVHRFPTEADVQALKKRLVGIWEVVWKHDLNADVEMALAIMEESR